MFVLGNRLVQEPVCDLLIKAGVVDLFFMELVVVPVMCMIGFRESFPNVLKM